MGYGRKKYIGGLLNIEEAARVYDYYTIWGHGIKAKTNFSYTTREVEEML